ncbi:hypothetical protein D9K80_13165 [Acinetobacter cumulans]|jgi:hypothetical protein|uniref:Lipoprotein n=1 Tax=Acinetobacter cumulans TaxID=2136182 RepID=A0A498D5R8_9GAMM|nr:hypothetical protein [Acinetobacter cumulans]RLL33155.1 hypothetical protein D9K80_13165 [Acinetobacter cumulans]
MFSFKSVVFKTTILLCSVWMLQACGNSSDHAEEKVVIKPAPKLTNDATVYANEAWKLINQVDHLVYEKKIAELDGQVRKPARKLSTDWRINVKMTDSVTEGKYALCRKALTSLDIWAREVLESSSDVAQKQADYERDKKQCQGAIDNPNLGNTDPKKIGV